MVYWLQGVVAAIAWVVLNSTYVLFLVPVFLKRYLNGAQSDWYLHDTLFPAALVFGVAFMSL